MSRQGARPPGCATSCHGACVPLPSWVRGAGRAPRGPRARPANCALCTLLAVLSLVSAPTSPARFASRMGTEGRTPAGRSAAMPIGNRARIVAGVLMALYVLEVGAATLIVCSDGGEVHGDVDYITALASHSDEVNRIVTDPQFSVDGVVRLNITTGQLDKICRFIWKLDQYTITWAVQWVNDMIDTFGYTMEQLVEMAAYIKIRALTVSIAWHSRNDEYYGAAPSDDYWVSIRQRERPYHFVAGIVRLHWLATGIRELTKLVRDICRVLVVRGTADRIIAKPFLNWANVLEYAAGHGEEFILEVLLDLPGVGVNDHIDAGTGNRTLLHCSAMNGHLGVVNLLVGWPGIVADLQDALLWTPLHYAVQYGHAAIVDVLLDAKVNRGVSIDLNKRDGNGLTPYTLAFNTRQGSVMAALERCGGYM